jgi:hypothetical protein
MERRATASQWRVLNPILAYGDIGKESDTAKYKIGDGRSKWNSIPYKSGGSIVTPPSGGGSTGGGSTGGGVSTDPSDIVQDSTHRFVTDAEKALWNGREIGVAGENLSSGDLCYFNTVDSKYYKCDATSETTSSGKLALVDSDVNISNSFNFIMNGKFATAGLTPGNYFASDIPGQMTNIAPVGTGKIVRIVGFATSSTIIDFNPSSTFIELA